MAEKLTVEGVIQEAAENIVKKGNDLKLSNTYLTAEVDRKGRLVEELKKEVAFLEMKKNTLAEDIRIEKKLLLDSIEERKREAEKKLAEAKALSEETRREQNFLDQEKSNVQGIRQQLTNSKQIADDLIRRVRDFADSLK